MSSLSLDYIPPRPISELVEFGSTNLLFVQLLVIMLIFFCQAIRTPSQSVPGQGLEGDDHVGHGRQPDHPEALSRRRLFDLVPHRKGLSI